MKKTLRSKRLILRPLQLHDAPTVTRLLAGDSDAIQMTANILDPLTEQSVRAWIAKQSGPGEHSYTVILAESQEVIGAVGLGGSSGKEEVGYWIGREYWNRGYATERHLPLRGGTREVDHYVVDLGGY